MRQKILKILVGMLVIALSIAAVLYYGIYVSPEKVTTKYETVSSSSIPESLDNVTIGFFSDVYYLSFMDEKRFAKMINKMQEAHVDVLLFGGDLFADPQNENINAEVITKLTEMLSSLEAPLGKFFVLGDLDCTTPDTRTLVSNIMYNAGFEDLTNKSIRLHNGKMESVTLIGIDNMINGSVDIQGALENTSADNFNIFFTHTPDPISTLPLDNVDVALAGHSLGGQIRIPFFGALESVEGAQKYSYGLYTYNGNLIRVSNGLGTKDADMRLFAPPQFNIIVLRKTK